MDMPLILTTNTIRVALLCYVLSNVLWLACRDQRRVERWARWCWTLGCVLFLAHMLCGFAYHEWSHAKVYAYTAQETRRLIGWEFGAGVYFNYLFAVVWSGDVVRQWWFADTKWASWCGVAAQTYMAFIAINGTVIFKTGWIRGLAVVALAALCFLAWRRYRLIKVSDDQRPDVVT